jgi:hypothetical protein
MPLHAQSGSARSAILKDIAGLLATGAPDPAKMKETMLRYGLIPAPLS